MDVLYVCTIKKKNSSTGIEKSAGPMVVPEGYVHILRRIRYESHGVVTTTAMEMRKMILYMSSRVQSGR